jgi:hypothetical protein
MGDASAVPCVCITFRFQNVANDNVLASAPYMDSRGQTYTTIRYPINLKSGWVAGVRGTGRYFSI